MAPQKYGKRKKEEKKKKEKVCVLR